MEKITKTLNKIGIHGVLSYSYLMFFVVLVLGVLCHFLIPQDYINFTDIGSWGMLLLAFGTTLILWSQNTSHKTHEVRENNKDKNITHHFKKGPYKIMRSPTHVGLAISLIGFGLTINSVATIALSVIAYIITKNYFLVKQELLLEEKYGESYREYKKSVKF